jgi:TonB family protein
MRVSATRRATDLAGGLLFLAVVFVGVIVLQGAVNGALRNAGVAGGLALLLSGAAAFGAVVGGFGFYRFWGAMTARRADAERERLGLPDGPTCIVWRGEEGAEMPWALTQPIRVHFPKIARRFGIEGVAVVEFDIAPEGQVKNIHCIDAWPADIFYDAAHAALKDARFVVRDGERPRFGPSYRMPFVFRIQGAARVTDRGRRARRGAKPKSSAASTGFKPS